MRASSSTRATPASGSTRVTVRHREPFSRCETGVPRMRQFVQDESHKNLIAVCKILQLPAHGFGGLAPMPASTSSKTSVFLRLIHARTVLNASMIRDNSPPDAILSSGRGSSPALADNRNSARSIPAHGRENFGPVHFEAGIGHGQRLQFANHEFFPAAWMRFSASG